MTDQIDLENGCWEVRWAAEISSRYHRRHAAWLNRFDFVLNIVQMLSATAAFVELTRDVPSRVAVIGTVVIGVCALIQIVGRLGKTALDHELLMREWCDLLTQVETTTPTAPLVSQWMRRRGELNKEHVGELRGLAVAAENEAASALGVPGRQRRIGRMQWLLMHIITIQRTFEIAPDLYPPVPPLADNVD